MKKAQEQRDSEKAKKQANAASSEAGKLEPETDNLSPGNQAKNAREESAPGPPASVNGDKGTAATVPMTRFRIVAKLKDGTVLADKTANFEYRHCYGFRGPVASSITIYDNTERLKFYTYVHHYCSAYGAKGTLYEEGKPAVVVPIGGATIPVRVASFKFTAEDDNGPPPPRNAKIRDKRNHTWIPRSAVSNDNALPPLVRQEKQKRPFFPRFRAQLRRLFHAVDAKPMISKKQTRSFSLLAVHAPMRLTKGLFPLLATAPMMLEKQIRPSLLPAPMPVVLEKQPRPLSLLAPMRMRRTKGSPPFCWLMSTMAITLWLQKLKYADLRSLLAKK